MCPIYTLYPCQTDGTALVFEALDLPSDASAIERAKLVLQQHSTASHLNVWRGERLVGAVQRDHVMAEAAAAGE